MFTGKLTFIVSLKISTHTTFRRTTAFPSEQVPFPSVLTQTRPASEMSYMLHNGYGPNTNVT